MAQQTGETRDAIIEDDNKMLQEILMANKNRKEPYYVLLFAKPSKGSLDGKPTLVKHMKAYAQRPPSYVGAVIGKVDNKTGEIEWEVNQPQRPFDYGALDKLGAKPGEEVVIETTTIPWAYVTQ